MDYVIGVAWWALTRAAIVAGILISACVLLAILALIGEAVRL